MLLSVLKIVLIIIAVYLIIFKILGLRVIGNDKMGIIEKWWSNKGSLKDGIIALHGEAGFLPDVLRGGIHFKPGFIYKVHIFPLITIPQGQMGYIFARGGQVLPNTQVLGKIIDQSNNFQDVRGFLENGGQKGPQRGILREGTYALNLAQFVVITKDRIYYLPIGDSSEREMLGKMQRDIDIRHGFEPIVIKGNENVSRGYEERTNVNRSQEQRGNNNNKTQNNRNNNNKGNNTEDNDKYDDTEKVSDNTQFGTINYKKDLIGIVTVQDGPSLPNEEIIAPVVGDVKDEPNYHNNFQNPENFLNAGGYKGKQLQVLTDGSYYINALFATVEFVPKTVVPVGFVGVVVSYTGKKGNDMTGVNYKHGELVQKGCKGVWEDPLMPGKYALNPYAMEVKPVPTTNIILKWASNEVGEHKLDANLSEVDLITKDAFQPSLPLSVVLHIDYKMAPWVIQRFGDMDKLVNQTLDPLIASYFKNVGQVKTLIELIQQRKEIQETSTSEMKQKFVNYNLELEEVLIGTPQASANDTQMNIVLEQLRQRQVAEEQVKTFDSQQRAAEKEKNLKEAQAMANQQSSLTESEINIKIEANKGQAEAKKAEQDAIKIKTIANAEADKIRVTGKAEADKIKDIGNAEASAIDAQVNAYGSPEIQLMEKVLTKFSEAVAQSNVDIVPKTVVNMGSDGSNPTNAFESLIKLMIAKNLGVDLKTPKGKDEQQEAAEEAAIAGADEKKIEDNKETDNKESEINK